MECVLASCQGAFFYFAQFWLISTQCELSEPGNSNKMKKSTNMKAHHHLLLQLGYTYDWHPRSKDNVGLSEFIIGKNADIVVKGFYTNEEYCDVPDKK